ncbi:glycosidase, partial [Escherichia coli]|nr:glycosidase [Escherichia coli]
LSRDGAKIVKIHYDKAIQPSAGFLDYGVEDARISLVGGRWWMTVCGVSAERHCTAMYHSVNGLDYKLLGVVLDHQNKDMILFEGKPGGR